MGKIIDNFKKVKPIYYIIGFFLLSVVFHYIFNDYPKRLNVYPDELRFYDIARNMHFGKLFVVNGIKSNYQKILYSLFLYPFFYIKNVTLRCGIISVANSIIMCSSIFPMYLIYNKMYDNSKKNEKDILIFLLFSFCSMFTYTMTYMSENLYAPIYFWSVYFLLLAITENKIRYYIISAIIIFIGYVCREIMIIYFASVIILMLIHFIKEKKLFDKKYVSYLIAFVWTFLLLLIIVKITLFKDMAYTYGGDAYNQVTMSVLSSFDVFIKLIHSCIYYIAAIFLLFMFFPIIILYNEYKNMSKCEKFVLLSNAINIILMAMTVAYTISIREDFEKPIVRLHFRYVIVSIALIWFISMKHINIENIKNIFSQKIDVVILIAMVIISTVFYNGLNVYDIDQTQMHWLSIIFSLIPIKVYYIRNIIFCIFIVLLYIFLYKMKKYNILKNVMIGIIVCIFLLNNIGAISSYKISYSAAPNLVKDVNRLTNYFLKEDDNVILYLTNEGVVRETKVVVDTYFESKNNILIAQDITLYFEDNADKNKVSDMSFYSYIAAENHKNINKIDYVLVDKMNATEDLIYNNMEEVNDIEMRNFKLYKNNNAEELNIEKGQ